MTDARVGFIGLGNIGSPMATRLAGWPGEVVVFDLVPENTTDAVKAGATAVASVADLAECDVVCTMVRTDEQVREVAEQLLAGERKPRVLVVHSTVAVDTLTQLAQLASPHGVAVVDAPVSGGAGGAAAGKLAVLVGADEEAHEIVHDPLSQLGKVVHCGELGAGTRMKLARNLLHFVSFTAAMESARLAQACGLSLKQLGDTVRATDKVTGGAGSIMLRDNTDPVADDDFWHGILTHVRDLGEKDLAHAIHLARDVGVDTPLADIALERLGDSLGVGRGEVAADELDLPKGAPQ